MTTNRALLVILLCLAAPAAGLGGEPVKLKYLHTLYADAAGSGLRSPQGVTVTDRYLFVADSGNHRIVRYLLQEGPPKPDAVFPVPKMFPLMVQEKADGVLCLLDGRDRRIRLLSADGAPLGDLDLKGMPDARRVVPRSFKIGRDGKIFLLDILSGRVLVLEADGTFRREVPFPSGAGFFSDLAVDGQGNLFLLDSVRGTVYRSSGDGKSFLPLAAGLKENMNFPTSLAPDDQGNLYLVDQYGSGLAILAPDGSFLGRRLGLGWGEGLLYYPTQIAIGAKGKIFIADQGNNRIQEFAAAD